VAVSSAGDGAPLDPHQLLHGAQALEGVLAVEEPALVHLSQVALYVSARQGGAAQQHRHGVTQLVQLEEVVSHDQRALHEQAAHAYGVGTDLPGFLHHL